MFNYCIIILLFNRKKYTFPIFIHIIGTTVLSYSFTKNLINSLLISLLFTYIMLTFFYKIKVERFINLSDLYNERFENEKENEKNENENEDENENKKMKKIQRLRKNH